MHNSLNSRRDFLRKSSFLALASLGTQLIAPSFLRAADPLMDPISGDDAFSLPPLPYTYDALEPYMDTMTMEIHHGKHHQAYVNNLNKAMKDGNFKASLSLEDLIIHASEYPMAIRNNGGGHWNHSFFWKNMKKGGGTPSGPLLEAIKSSFNTLDEFIEKFNDAALKRFGSGWAWLIVNKNHKLEIGSTPNQDNPLMDLSDLKGTPVLGVDVWEHAYYLRYQNKRADYLAAWWKVLNWEDAGKNFSRAM